MSQCVRCILGAALELGCLELTAPQRERWKEPSPQRSGCIDGRTWWGFASSWTHFHCLVFEHPPKNLPERGGRWVSPAKPSLHESRYQLAEGLRPGTRLSELVYDKGDTAVQWKKCGLCNK